MLLPRQHGWQCLVRGPLLLRVRVCGRCARAPWGGWSQAAGPQPTMWQQQPRRGLSGARWALCCLVNPL